jgi:hypothetical protein
MVTTNVGGGDRHEGSIRQRETADRKRWLELFDELPVEKRDLLATVGFLEGSSPWCLRTAIMSFPGLTDGRPIVPRAVSRADTAL